MWPFDIDDRLRRRVKALETRLGELEETASTLATSTKNTRSELQAQLDTVEAWLRKVSGVVHGRRGAEISAEKNVPARALDKLDKNELRARVGLMPGKAAPKVGSSDTTIEE